MTARTATKAKPKTARRSRKPPPVVRCEDVGYVYDDGTVALEGVNLTVRPGEAVTITGPNQCGKSTLLSLIGGELKPTAGTVDVGEVGWLVPALGVTVADAHRLGAQWGQVWPVHKWAPGGVVLADEAVDGVDDLAEVDAFHDVVLEVRDRGSAVVLVAHAQDTAAVCDRTHRLGPGGVHRRPILHATYRRLHSDPLPPANLETLADLVEDSGLPLIDHDHGTYVVLPQVNWENRQFAALAHWFIIDAPTMARLRRRQDRSRERVAGPRVDGRRRLLGREGDKRDVRARFGGYAAEITDHARFAWWPGHPEGAPAFGPLDDLEDQWAVVTAYQPDHPLALPAPMCDELIGLGLADEAEMKPAFVTGRHDRPDELVITEAVPGEIRQRLVLAMESANATWWRFEIEDYELILKRYQPGQGFGRHSDLAAGASTRKLAATVQLSDPGDYEGGDVILEFLGTGVSQLTAPPAKGAITVWPAWTAHEVHPVTSGERWCLVIWGFGHPFR